MSYCKTQEFAFKKMGVEFQSYVILKRLELEVSAWSRFVEFLKLFKMLMDLKWKICVVFSQSWKTKRPVFFLATVMVLHFAVFPPLLHLWPCQLPLYKNLIETIVAFFIEGALSLKWETWDKQTWVARLTYHSFR